MQLVRGRSWWWGSLLFIGRPVGLFARRIRVKTAVQQHVSAAAAAAAREEGLNAALQYKFIIQGIFNPPWFHFDSFIYFSKI